MRGREGELRTGRDKHCLRFCFRRIRYSLSSSLSSSISISSSSPSSPFLPVAAAVSSTGSRISTRPSGAGRFNPSYHSAAENATKCERESKREVR